MSWFKISDRRGKRSVDERLRGLVPKLFDYAEDRTILDVGCAEGMIGLEMARRGARAVDGVDVLPDRIVEAQRIFHEAGHVARFRCADVAKIEAVDLDAHYDVILLLGILHKLRQPEALISFAIGRARELIAIRVPDPMAKQMIQALEPRFRLIHAAEPSRSNRLGWAGLFEKVSSGFGNA